MKALGAHEHAELGFFGRVRADIRAGAWRYLLEALKAIPALTVTASVFVLAGLWEFISDPFRFTRRNMDYTTAEKILYTVGLMAAMGLAIFGGAWLWRRLVTWLTDYRL